MARRKRKDGPYVLRYKDGTIGLNCTYKDGKFDGLYEEFYENGQLRVRRIYKDGKLDGLFEFYKKDGTLFTKYGNKDGKIEGPYEDHYINGNLRKKCTYKDGKMDGLCEIYSKDGELEKKAWYIAGKEVTLEEYEKHLVSIDRKTLADTLKGLRRDYGAKAKFVSGLNKKVAALREKIGNKR